MVSGIGTLARESLGSVGHVGWRLCGLVSSGTFYKNSIRLGCGDFGSQAKPLGTLCSVSQAVPEDFS